jgi:hypothetical protein
MHYSYAFSHRFSQFHGCWARMVLQTYISASDKGLTLYFCFAQVATLYFRHSFYSIDHRWASASIKLTPASAFRHLSSQSGTAVKKCRTASFYSGTGSVPASLVFLSPVPDWLDAGQSGIPVVSIAVVSTAVVSIAVVSIAAVVIIVVPVVSIAVVSIDVFSPAVD